MTTRTNTQLLLSAWLLLLPPLFASAAPVVLAIPEVEQEQSQWCWAGVSDAVLQYWGMELHQCEIAEYTRQVATWHDFGDVDCCVDPSQGCNYWNYNWTYDGSIEDILEHFAGIGSSGTGRLSEVEVSNAIDAGQPFIPRWGWDSGGGHFIVGHGFEAGEFEPGVCDFESPFVELVDPAIIDHIYTFGPYELFAGGLSFSLQELYGNRIQLYLKKDAPASPADFDYTRYAVDINHTVTEPGQYFIAIQTFTDPGQWGFELTATCEESQITPSSLYYMNPWYGEGLKVAAYDWIVQGSNHTWTSTNRIDTSPSCICSTVDACCDGCRPFEDGTPCDDGDPLTTGETCIAGICRSCSADFDGSGDVGFADLTQLLSVWGLCAAPCSEDLDDNGDVGFADLTTLLSDWGPCS